MATGENRSSISNVDAVVIGAGIAGLVAAHSLSIAGVKPLVIEATSHIGGVVQTTTFADKTVDLGADSLIVRDPATRQYLTGLGLWDKAVSPAMQGAYVLNDRLHPLAPGLSLGMPTRLQHLMMMPKRSDQVQSILRLTRTSLSRTRISPGTVDASVAELIHQRLGPEYNDQVVDALLGGVYAGDTDQMSAIATHPALAQAARERRMISGLRRIKANTADVRFVGFVGGMVTLTNAIAAQLTNAGVQIATNEKIISIVQDDLQYIVTTDQRTIQTPRVVLAVHPHIASRILDTTLGSTPVLRSWPSASVAMILMAYPKDRAPVNSQSSGFVATAKTNRMITACSYASNKWLHLHDPDINILRVSVGRFGRDAALDLDDEELVAGVASELREIHRWTNVAPVVTHVQRWSNAFPQYNVGHRARLTAIDGILRPYDKMVLVGNAYNGIGLAATMQHARDQAQALI
jgi:oxygen-dependent protoporphyrinogen oxidase